MVSIESIKPAFNLSWWWDVIGSFCIGCQIGSKKTKLCIAIHLRDRSWPSLGKCRKNQSGVPGNRCFAVILHVINRIQQQITVIYRLFIQSSHCHISIDPTMRNLYKNSKRPLQLWNLFPLWWTMDLLKTQEPEWRSKGEVKLGPIFTQVYFEP